ncbi:putative thioredoxin [Tuber brumale]|nr:putative thioredoxin [Tuber brumale]
MANISIITSPQQLEELKKTSTLLIIDFHATWCAPCKLVNPIFVKLVEKFASPGKIVFAKCDVDENQQISKDLDVTVMPSFLVFRNEVLVERIQGANPMVLRTALTKLVQEVQAVDSGSSSAAEGLTASETKPTATSSTSAATASTTAAATSTPAVNTSGDSDAGWLGAELPKPYNDVTDQVDLKQLDLLNANSEFGESKTLFDTKAPSNATASSKGKEKDSGTEAAAESRDWVESDTDEQLMLFIPFQSTVKIHTLQVTSLAPAPEHPDYDKDSDTPSRPKTIKIWVNPSHTLSFEDGESPATQEITLNPSDWDPKTGTVSVPLKYVKFQSVSTLNIFFVDVENEDAEKVRIDRLRIIGEKGEKKEMGKLEKIGDLSGE